MENPDRILIVLIVEDIDWIRLGMKASAERHGYRVVEAADDAEALEVMEREWPELVLTDEALPTFGALTERLREHPSFNSLPVVIINPDAREGERLGGAFLLTSYESIESLLTSLR